MKTQNYHFWYFVMSLSSSWIKIWKITKNHYFSNFDPEKVRKYIFLFRKSYKIILFDATVAIAFSRIIPFSNVYQSETTLVKSTVLHDQKEFLCVVGCVGKLRSCSCDLKKILTIFVFSSWRKLILKISFQIFLRI